MIVESLLTGAAVGLGLYALVRVFVRSRPGVGAMVARIDSGQRSMRTHTVTSSERPGSGVAGAVEGLQSRIADWVEVRAAERQWDVGRTRSDLAVMNRTIGQFVATKVLLGVGLFLLGPVVWAVLRVSGAPLPAAAPVVLALLLGVFGFFVPDLALRGEAEQRRRDFRRVVGAFLDLVAMNLAGGRGLPEALLAASTISDHWSLVRIRQALANARLFGTTPWAALGELGDELGIEELRDMSGALGLAADDGAKIRASLSARAATLRRKEMSDEEGQAGERSQSMLVAQMLICAAFLVFLAYPAVAQLLANR